MEILPGIHQFRVPIPNNPLGNVNVYLVKSGGESLLIDAGWNTDEAFGALARQLGEAGVPLAGLTYLAFTHVHPDHYGLAGRLVQHSHASLIIHEIEKTLLQSRYVDVDGLLEEMDQWLRVNGAPDEERPRMGRASLGMIDLVAVALPDRPVQGGEHVRVGEFDLEVIWTPGHSPGHICFYDRSHRVFVSGDHVLPGISPNISMHIQSMGNPLADYLDSLQAIEDLDVDLVLPSHGEPFRDLAGRVREIRAHHRQREQDIQAAFAGRPMTAYQVAATIPWNTKGVPWIDLPYWVKRGAMTEALAHLELMRSRNLLRKTVQAGTIWYEPDRPRNSIDYL